MSGFPPNTTAFSLFTDLFHSTIALYSTMRKIPSFANDTKYIFIASIGNPEPSYAGTRHNVGHRVMDHITNNYWKGHVYKQGPFYLSTKYPNIVLFKSDSTFMNIQGRVIQKHFNQLPKGSQMLVLHDELERPLGKFQLRQAGTSSRGHNGLKSIDGFCKSYQKLGIGIGKPTSGSVSDYVLKKFDSQIEIEELDLKVIPKVIKKLEEVIEVNLQSQLQVNNLSP